MWILLGDIAVFDLRFKCEKENIGCSVYKAVVALMRRVHRGGSQTHGKMHEWPRTTSMKQPTTGSISVPLPPQQSSDKPARYPEGKFKIHKLFFILPITGIIGGPVSSNFVFWPLFLTHRHTTCIVYLAHKRIGVQACHHQCNVMDLSVTRTLIIPIMDIKLSVVDSIFK